VSRKDDAAEMILNGEELKAVVAATGLQARTVYHIQRRLDQPIYGDNTYEGKGIIPCRLCGRPLLGHKLATRCEAGDLGAV